MSPPPKAKHEAIAELDELLRGVLKCRACDLWRLGTRAVFGEGPVDARLMLVGEQPGDKEETSGKPFVGPAGRILDRALADAGIERDKAYVTNAVKHFKFTRRGKIRLHQKPDAAEIRACNPWLVSERALIRPELIVAMGATAARGVFGRAMPVGKNRRRIFALADAKAMITVHPSYLLRVSEEDREREYAQFLADLKLAARTLRPGTRASA